MDENFFFSSHESLIFLARAVKVISASMSHFIKGSKNSVIKGVRVCATGEVAAVLSEDACLSVSIEALKETFSSRGSVPRVELRIFVEYYPATRNEARDLAVKQVLLHAQLIIHLLTYMHVKLNDNKGGSMADMDYEERSTTFLYRKVNANYEKNLDKFVQSVRADLANVFDVHVDDRITFFLAEIKTHSLTVDLLANKPSSSHAPISIAGITCSVVDYQKWRETYAADLEKLDDSRRALVEVDGEQPSLNATDVFFPVLVHTSGNKCDDDAFELPRRLHVTSEILISLPGSALHDAINMAILGTSAKVRARGCALLACSPGIISPNAVVCDMVEQAVMQAGTIKAIRNKKKLKLLVLLVFQSFSGQKRCKVLVANDSFRIQCEFERALKAALFMINPLDIRVVSFDQSDVVFDIAVFAKTQ